MMFLSDLSEDVSFSISSSQHNSRPDLEDFDSSLVLPEDLSSALQTVLAVWHTRWQASVKDKNFKHFLMISIL